MEDITCCVKSCEKPLDQSYWDLQYQSETTGWDLGTISPPIKAYVDQLKDYNFGFDSGLWEYV